MKNLQQNSSKTIIEMNNDQVYEIGDMLIITTRRRVITDGENQGVMMIYSPNHTETKKQELIGKIYPRFTDEKTGKEYEGFLPANGLIVEMHLKNRFYKLVAEIEEDILTEMKHQAKRGILNDLTIDKIEELRGKRIQVIYFGYKGQDGVKDFTVGEIISQYDLAKRDITIKDFANRAEYWNSYMSEKQLSERKNKVTILTNEGKETYINAFKSEGLFWCSDEDRFVLYREAK